jgi:hypothetical protein
MVGVLNQLSQPPEERLSDYLGRCFDNYYAEQGEEQKLRDLGYQPGQIVIPEAFSQADLERVMAQVGVSAAADNSDRPLKK